MNRRAFSFIGIPAAALAASSLASAARDDPRGVRVRFAFTKVVETADRRSQTRFVQELGVLLKPGETFTMKVQGGCRLTMTPEIEAGAIRVSAVVVDEERYPDVEMPGTAVVEPGLGGAIKFQGPGEERYALGILVTMAELPRASA